MGAATRQLIKVWTLYSIGHEAVEATLELPTSVGSSFESRPKNETPGVISQSVI
jgi:hypothetical protein